MNDTAPENDRVIEWAIVQFTDSLPAAEFDQVEFLPDGRLKATLTVSIVEDGRYFGTATETAYYAPGAWLSVRPQPRGTLLAELAPGQPRVVASGIPQTAAQQHIADWLPLNRIQSTYPEIGDTTNLFGTIFTAYDRAGNMTDAISQDLAFRWVWPPNHDLPLEARAARPSIADQP